MRDPRELAQLLQAAPMSRRYLLQRAALLGVSLPVFGSLLAACEVDDEDDDIAVDDVTDDEDPAVEPDDDDVDPVDDTDDAVDDDEPVDDTDDDVEDDPDTDAQAGGRLVLLGHHPLESLHPDDAGPTVTWTGVNAIHEPLIGIDHAYELEMVLATDYEISDDGMEYTLTLRDRVVFHDGEEFNADEVALLLREVHGCPLRWRARSPTSVGGSFALSLATRLRRGCVASTNAGEDAVRDGEPQACAAFIARPCFIGPVKPVKKAVEMFR
jgi:hypothetical protein